MILPTKGVSPDRAMLTVGAEILELLDSPKTVASLWYDLTKVRETRAETRIRYDWFVLALDVLYALDAVALGSDNLLRPRYL